MDFISNNAIEVTSLALNGLAERNKVLAANIANADTPGFKRSDIKFEDQLGKMVMNYNAIETKKLQNSTGLMYNPNSLDSISNNSSNASKPDNQQNIYENFNPETVSDNNGPVKADGNNVNIEYEMAESAKNGTKYNAIATFQEKLFKNMQDVINKGV